MKLEKTRSKLEHFKEIISKIKRTDPNYFVFLNYITEYIVVIFYAEIEDCVQKIVSNRLQQAGLSVEGISFIEKNLRRNYNNDLLRIVEDFKGKHDKKSFEKLTHFQKFKNLIELRHCIAHARQEARPQMTWQEIQDIAKVGENMMKNLIKSIS
ncbi:MAG: hypothetical protein SFV53_04585 [Rickettsiales bacterium]|nr:hypothetical protein [Rickettsiales bacterium]